MRTKEKARPNTKLTPRAQANEQDAAQPFGCTCSKNQDWTSNPGEQTHSTIWEKPGDNHQSKGARLAGVLKRNLSPRMESQSSETERVQEQKHTNMNLSPNSAGILRYVEQSLQQNCPAGLSGLLHENIQNENALYITSSRIQHSEGYLFDIQECEDTPMENTTTRNEETTGRDEEDFFSEDHNPWSQDIFDEMNVQPEANCLEEQQNVFAGEDAKNQNFGEGEQQRGNVDDTTINEEDIEIFLENEEGGNLSHAAVIEEKDIPSVGKTFNSEQAAQKFCNDYSYMAGFALVVAKHYRTTSKKRNNEITSFTMRCNKFGKSSDKENAPAESIVPERDTNVIDKTGCKCSVIVKENNGMWKITNVQLEHNHEIGPVSESKFFRSHKYMTVEEKAMIRTMKKVNIPTRNMVAILSYMRGGRAALTYDDKDVANYSYNIGREKTVNDMTQMLNFFSERQAENPGFYYSVEMDDNNKVKNIFWADARAREYYKTYGDCISFDTTFLTNKYNLPFAPIVGVSAHGNTYLFACAFLGDETATTFNWVFSQFLQAMDGKHPQSIITDQDGAMMKAIKETFPNTTHRQCWFHVKKILEEKMVNVFPLHKGLYAEMKDILDNSITVDEFEQLWPEMIHNYDLHHLSCLSNIWEKRVRFVPVYYKDEFFPFIQSTARSEGTNSVFRKGVGPQYSVMSFLNEYHRITETIQNREDRFDYHTRNRKRSVLWSKYNIETQAHELYNKAIFVKFQRELKETTALQCEEIEKDKFFHVFVDENQPIQPHRVRKYLVEVHLQDKEYSCICGKFNKDGLLCSHILKVMLQLKIRQIPEKYIIDRWRKNEKKISKEVPALTTADSSTLRFNNLSRRLVTVASKASKEKTQYGYVFELSKVLEEQIHTLADTEGEKINIQELTQLSRRLLTLATIKQYRIKVCILA